MSIEHTYIENMAVRKPAPLRVYFAGKVRQNDRDWRSSLFSNGRIMSGLACNEEVNIYDGGYPHSAGTVLYAGPSALSCDHGCWHGTDHGIVNYFDNDKELQHVHAGRACPDELAESCPDGSNGLSKKQAVERCIYQIRRAEAIYAFIDSADCHGTLTEIGYAYAVGVPIHLVFCNELKDSRTIIDHDNHGMEMEHDDFWFIKQMATTVDHGRPWAGVRHIASLPNIIASGSFGIKRNKIKASDRVKVLVRDNY